MAKQPSRPGIPVPPGDDDSGSRHRTCGVGRAALVRTEQLAQRLDDHVDDDDDRLGALARDVETVNRKVETVDRKVDAAIEHVGDLRVDVAKMGSTLAGIGASLAEQNELRHVRVVAEVNAEVETGKVQKIAAIEDEADRRKARRALWLKVALAVVAAAGTALGALIEHYR